MGFSLSWSSSLSSVGASWALLSWEDINIHGRWHFHRSERLAQQLLPYWKSLMQLQENAVGKPGSFVRARTVLGGSSFLLFAAALHKLRCWDCLLLPLEVGQLFFLFGVRSRSRSSRIGLSLLSASQRQRGKLSAPRDARQHGITELPSIHRCRSLNIHLGIDLTSRIRPRIAPIKTSNDRSINSLNHVRHQTFHALSLFL